MPQHRVGSGGEHSVASSMQAQSSGGEHPAAPLGLEWPPLPQTTASMPRSGGSHPVTSLPQALARLRGDDSEEARRIREAETLVKRGNQIEIRKLCTTDAGWGVSRRVSGKKELTTIANHVLTLSRLLQACMHLHHDTRPGLWHAAFGFGAGFGARAGLGARAGFGASFGFGARARFGARRARIGFGTRRSRPRWFQLDGRPPLKPPRTGNQLY